MELGNRVTLCNIQEKVKQSCFIIKKYSNLIVVYVMYRITNNNGKDNIWKYVRKCKTKLNHVNNLHCNPYCYPYYEEYISQE